MFDNKMTKPHRARMLMELLDGQNASDQFFERKELGPINPSYLLKHDPCYFLLKRKSINCFSLPWLLERKISIEFDKIPSEMEVKAIRKKQKCRAFMMAHDGKKKVISDELLKHIVVHGYLKKIMSI